MMNSIRQIRKILVQPRNWVIAWRRISTIRVQSPANMWVNIQSNWTVIWCGYQCYPTEWNRWVLYYILQYIFSAIMVSNPAICFCSFNTEGRLHLRNLLVSPEFPKSLIIEEEGAILITCFYPSRGGFFFCSRRLCNLVYKSMQLRNS